MNTRARVRRLGTAAALLTSVLGGGSFARAQAPAADPPPEVEVYRGARKVWPLPAAPVPPPPLPVVPCEYKGGPVIEEPGRASAAFEAACVAVRDGSKSVSTAATNLMDRVADRMAFQTEARQIVLASYVPPPQPVPQPFAPPAHLPWLTAAPPTVPPTQPATLSTPQPPTVVVIREREPAAEVQQIHVPAPQPPRGLVLTPELMIAAGFGVLGLMFMLAAWMRTARHDRPVMVPVAAPPMGASPLDGGVRLQGQYNAGPVPETAEKFDLGPTYHDDVAAKKQVEVRNNDAVVQFILDQNLALMDALNPLPEGDAADFEISMN